MMNAGDPDPLHPELGPLQEEFRAVAWRPWLFSGGCLLTTLGCVAGVLLMPLVPLAVDQGETPEARATASLGLLIFAGVCAGITILVVWRTLRQRRLRLRLHERGLFFHDGGSRAQKFLWDEVASFQAEVTRVSVSGIPTRTFRSYTLKKETGETLRLTNNAEIRNVERVADRIAQETLARLLPRALAAVDAGAAVPFGGWTVTGEDVARGPKARLPWSEVGVVETDAYGAIVVRQRGQRSGPWARLAYGKVPNAHVFLPLADTLRERAVPMRP